MNTVDFQDAIQVLPVQFKNRRLRPFYESVFYREEEPDGIQVHHTPTSLCADILERLNKFVDLKTANIAILCNPEFVDVATTEMGIPPGKLFFFADSELKKHAVEEMFKVEVVGLIRLEEGKRIIMPKTSKKFDVVVMNPPYQPPVKKKTGGSGSSNVLWDKFVALGLDLLEKDGYLAAVHPNKWRKPDDDLFKTMTAQNLLHLEMYSKKDGIKTFGAQTPYDWYILQKSKYAGKTTIKDFKGEKQTLNLKQFNFLPNCDIPLVQKLLAKNGESKCDVLYSRTVTAKDRPWVQEEETKKFCYPCIHTTGKSGVRYCYSSKREGFFDIPKVIFGDGDVIGNAVVDFEGKYSMTQHAIGIRISSQEEGEQMKKALESPVFNELLQNSLRFSQFMIDWKVFTVFRKDFWKEFI